MKSDVDADGNHVLDGAGERVGVVVGITDDGTPIVSWFADASPYGSPLASLLDPPSFP